jgi:hypothetical protein
MPVFCQRFFDAINIDPFSSDHQRKLRETLRWADEEQAAKARKEEERAQDKRERRARAYTFLCGAAATVFGIVATWLWQHFIGHQ